MVFLGAILALCLNVHDWRDGILEPQSRLLAKRRARRTPYGKRSLRRIAPLDGVAEQFSIGFQAEFVPNMSAVHFHRFAAEI